MKPSFHASPKRIRALLIVLVLFSLVPLAWVALPRLEKFGVHLPSSISGLVDPAAPADIQPTHPPATPTETTTPTPSTPTNTAVPIVLQNDGSADEGLRQQGVMILALRDGTLAIFLPITHSTYR